MHDVPKLVEIGLHLIVLQQGRGVGRGLGEVGHHGGHRDLPAGVRQEAAGLEAEAGGVAVLPFPGEGQEPQGSFFQRPDTATASLTVLLRAGTPSDTPVTPSVTPQ